MRILHAITGMQKAAGTSVFCGELANELVAKGHDVAIATNDYGAKYIYPLDERVTLVPLKAVRVEEFDVVHIHALWAPSLHRISKDAHKSKIPVIWSPHGMLQEWALNNKWLKKRLALALYQKCDLKNAQLLHATAETEVEDIRRLGLTNNVVVAPLGVRISSRVEQVQKNERTLLFVSRVQRKKGLPVLIDAWAALSQEVKKNWTVRIVGPDQDNHTAELKAQCKRLGVIDDFIFVGPKYGAELDAEYHLADLFVLPTHSENFGSVVIEALACGIPVICSQGAPWQELETHKCGWWPEDSVDSLRHVLIEALNLPDKARFEMGRRGVRLVEAKYTWDAVCRAMLHGYSRFSK